MAAPLLIPAAMAVGSYLLNKSSTDSANKVAGDMSSAINKAGQEYKSSVEARYADPKVSGGAFREVADDHAGYKGEGYSLANVDKYINPALAFAQKQAMNQIQGSAAGSGTLFGGGTARELVDRTNQLAYQAYQDASDRSTAETARLDGNADANAARSLNVRQINNAGAADERTHFTNIANQFGAVDNAIYQGKVSGAQAVAGAKMGKTGAGTDLLNLGVTAGKIYSGISG